MTLRVPPLSEDKLAELDGLYRKTRDPRIRTRVQIVLLSVEHRMTPPEIARIVRMDEDTVRVWLKRYMAEGVNGLYDAPRSGAPKKIDDAFREKLLTIVRQRPRSLDQPYSMWTLQRLADYMAEQTGVRVVPETIRLYLQEADIVLSRPQHTVSSPDPEYQVKKRRLKKPETI